MDMKREPVEVVACLRALCLRCGDYAGQRGVRLSFDSNVAALTLAADRELLSRAALDLIMNALRFSPSGGGVAVRCTALGDFVELSVTDRGAGSIFTLRLPVRGAS